MINWPLILTAIGVISSLILGITSLWRTFKRDSSREEKENISKQAKNLDEIFDGNQKLLENYSKDNEALRQRVTEVEKEMADLKQKKQAEIDVLVGERNELSHKLLESQRENAKLLQQVQLNPEGG